MERGNLAIPATLLTHTPYESKAGKYFNLQTEKESVALLGAHTLGRAMTSMSGFQVFLCVDIVIVKIVRKMSTLYNIHYIEYLSLQGVKLSKFPKHCT